MKKEQNKELSKETEQLNDFLKNQKILDIKRFRSNEVVIICEEYTFFIDGKKDGILEFSITEN